MTANSPPLSLERLLLFLLPPRDRETISGDLLEEYREEQLPRLGPARANLWYLRQLAGFASIRFTGGPRMKQTLTALCLLVAAAAAWLCLMENVLRHDGYVQRAAIDAALALQAIATLIFVRLGGPTLVRGVIAVAALAAALYGASAIRGVLHARHFEGFVLIIGAALILEGIVALLVLFQPRPPTSLHHI